MRKVNRFNFFDKPTPIEFLNKLTKFLNGPKIFVKRDDLTNVALGGNKVRKLEYLMLNAIKNKYDTIFTIGGPQSNHCRITAGICAKLGLKCVLVLSGKPSELLEGNLLLDKIFGAEIYFAGSSDFNKVLMIAEGIADNYRKTGYKPYLIPLGGASGIGSLGYVECFIEILKQIKQDKLNIDYIVIACGSGGTHSGLEVGKILSDSQIEIIGISVLFKKHELVEKIYNNIKEVINVLNLKKEHNSGITIYDEYIGKGYAIPTELTLSAMKIMGRKEGIVLDPVYTGKAFGGLIDLIRKKTFSKKDNILFIHTGGYPGIVKLSESDKAYF
jgi:D-cysteine desulfhydrase family pyridoxal phosphate-dependent enzyme